MNAVKAAVLTVVACSLLWTQILFVRQAGFEDLSGSSWRFWDDLTLAVARYVDRTRGDGSAEDDHTDLNPLVRVYQPLIEEKVRNNGLKLHQFWGTVQDKQFWNRLSAFSLPPNEDPGRSLLLLGGFRLFGGVAPFLLFWLGFFFFAPTFFWLLFELVRNGAGAAAITIAALVSFSPFWFECISLPHSAMGFYLGGLVALAAFAVAILFRDPGRPLPARSVIALTVLITSVLIVATWCRSGSIFFVPSAMLVAAVGFRRAGLRLRRSAGIAVALTLVPAVAFRPHQTHNIWLSFWEGLGDFGTDRGYSWYDVDAGKFLATKGLPLRTELRYVSATEEAVFRRDFLEEVTSSPGWYISVLGRRLVATLGLTHLDPWGPRDGSSRKTPLFHYKYTTPVDWFGWKERIREVPVSTLYLPTIVALWLGFRARFRFREELGVLASIALATLPVPILISTASGLETQAFSFVYFLGAAFLVQRVADRLSTSPKHA